MDLTSHYQEIAAEIAGICNSNYQSAHLNGDLSEEGVVGVKLKCVDADGEVQLHRVGGMGAFRISNALQHIRETMTMAGEEAWSRCTFTLFPDGRFKFDVEYDD